MLVALLAPHHAGLAELSVPRMALDIRRCADRGRRRRGVASGILAVGVNCTAPRHLPDLLARPGVDGAADRRVPQQRRTLGRREPALARPTTAVASTPSTVASWAGLGATWLGGCCGTGPADIAALAERVRAA